MKIFLGYFISISYLLFIILLASYLYLFKKINKEVTRKLIHIGSFLTWFIMIYFFSTSIHLVLLPLLFIIVNLISYKFKVITAMERNDESSIGTIYYAISIFIMALISYFRNDFIPYYGIGYMIMAFGDGLASLIGRYGKKKICNSKKTYLGSFTVMIVSFIILYLFKNYYNLSLSILGIIFYSILSTIIEFYGKKGIDNITLPLGISILSYLVNI